MTTSTTGPETSATVASRLTSVRAMLRKNAADLTPVGALLLLIAVFTVLDSDFLTVRNWQGIASQSAVPLVLGVGMTFVILMTAIDLSLEGMLVASSLTVALLVADLEQIIERQLHSSVRGRNPSTSGCSRPRWSASGSAC